ncbi:alpha/beta hydrolase fold protein-like protein [Viridothelium virens]|uniref:Alpha/beta hydrolase fold protein-like protein n=1 Tax=Viridothelium virens TaxID=1048519 RepID=A0A6A6HFH5_VIRVR|nr:alpha/beta hydrolase fold protein-like protein [Viridothelium virens]
MAGRATLNPVAIDDTRWEHGNVFLDASRSIRLHYIDCLPPKPAVGAILLVHGFPQTSYQFRHVITPLSDAGYRVIAPDYRGAGESSHPKTGFDKTTIANDLHTLVYSVLDIGGMIAHAYALHHASDTKSVMWGECPLPGADPYESGFKYSPGMWHFTFQQQLDLPEALVYGREKIYLKHFYDRLCVNPAGITSRDLEHYATNFAMPGAMRCGFELYRAFPQDAEDNLQWLKKNGKSGIPAAALDGDRSLLLEVAEAQTRQFYEQWEVITVQGSGHWTAEENPEDFVRKVLGFVQKHD